MEQKMNQILVCVDEIAEISHGSKLSEKFFDSVGKQTDVVKQYLGVESSKLAVYWSILLNLTILNSSSDLNDISRFLNSSMIKILSIVPEFEELVKLKLLRKDRTSEHRRRRNVELNSLKYFVPTDIIISLTKGEMTLPIRKKENISQWEILDIVASLIKNDLTNEMIDYKGLCYEIDYLMEENKSNSFIKKIKSFQLPILEQIILMFVCSEFTLNEEFVDLPRLVRALFEDTGKQIKARKEFIETKTRLQKLDLIDLVSGNFKNDSEIRLTENGSTIMFEEDKNFFVQNSKSVQKDMILSSSITEQKLFFNEKEQKSIDFLTDLLKPDNFSSVFNRLKDSGLKIGLPVLLYGNPGTGKTETVYQISRKTGRDIKLVNMAETKSMYFGESEKRIKKVFDSYKKLVETSELTPILLFNEVDGVFGTRKTVGKSSVDQTQNTIQNIILQEMEDFNYGGILLSTTNLPENLKDFERRFLYKIQYDKPDSNTRFLIWKDKLPILTDDEILELSNSHLLSGGQIMNVSKKIKMTQILTGLYPSFKEIHELCESEFLERRLDHKPIGFRIGSD